MTPVESTVNVILIGMGAIGKGVVRHLHAYKDQDVSPFPNGTKITLHSVIDYVDDQDEHKQQKQNEMSEFLARYFKSAGISFDGASIAKLEKVFAESKAKGQSTVVIECTGSKKLVELFNCCLANRVPVITPNKAFLAENMYLLDDFMKGNVPLLFEAAVGGGMPTIKLLRDMFSSDRISLMAGILNGTTNFILSAMEKGIGFEEAREKACARHLAEPSKGGWIPEKDLDLNGSDTFSKISLLARLVWGCTANSGVADLENHGLPACYIRRGDIRYAKEKLKSAVRFVGIARHRTDSTGKQSLDVFYSPVMLSAEHELYQVKGENNALLIASDFTGASFCVGPGAGPSPTANAIISDLLYLLRERAMHPETTGLASGAAQFASDPTLAMRKFKDVWFDGYYLRFVVKDQPGLVGDIAKILGKMKIGIQEVLQLEHSGEEIREFLQYTDLAVEPGEEWKYLPFAMTVGRAPVKDVMKAVESIQDYLKKEQVLSVNPVIIPLLNIPRVNGWQKRCSLAELEELSIEDTSKLEGNKYSVDLFPERYNATENSGGLRILDVEKKRIEAGAQVKRIFLYDTKPINGALTKVIEDHKSKGIDVRVLAKEKATQHLRRIEDGLFVDFAVYAAQEIGIVELAIEENGRMKTTNRGYQVYGSAELDGYIRTFNTLWAFAEIHNIT
jgi:homoserine dehydrogenase